MMSARRAAFLALTLAAAFWGLAPVTTRELVAHLEPLHVLLLRFSIASAIFAPFLIRLRTWQPGDRLKMLGCALIAVLGYYIPVTIGGKFLPSSVTGLLVVTQTLWMAGIAVLFLHEPLTLPRLAGIGVSTAGILLLLGGTALRALSGDLLLGSALTLLGAAMWAIYSLLMRPLASKYGALPVTAFTVIFGLIPLLFSISPNLGPEVTAMTTTTLIALVILALCSTVIGNFLWSFALVRVSAVEASLFLYLVPLISVVGGALLLREAISLAVITSGLLIVGGVAIAQLGRLPARWDIKALLSGAGSGTDGK